MRRKRAQAEAADLVDIDKRLAPHVHPDEPGADAAVPDGDEHEDPAQPIPAER